MKKEKKEKRAEELEKYYTGRINLDSERWLSFEREMKFDYYEDDAIVIKLQDNALQTTTLLATLFDSKWTVSNEHNGRLMWSIFKEHPKAVKRILKFLRFPAGNFEGINLEWQCLQRRFRLQSIRLKRKLHI